MREMEFGSPFAERGVVPWAFRASFYGLSYYLGFQTCPAAGPCQLSHNSIQNQSSCALTAELLQLDLCGPSREFGRGSFGGKSNGWLFWPLSPNFGSIPYPLDVLTAQGVPLRC